MNARNVLSIVYFKETEVNPTLDVDISVGGEIISTYCTTVLRILNLRRPPFFVMR